MGGAVEVLLNIKIEPERDRAFFEPISHTVLQNIQDGVTGTGLFLGESIRFSIGFFIV